MKIAVIGAGAIGALVAGYLKLKNEDVTLVGHPDSVKAIRESGLQISGVRGDFKVKIDVSERLDFQPDLIILATKTQDIDAALKDNLGFVKKGILLTTQNGIQADNIVTQYIGKENIISTIVMFGATYLEPGKVIHNFEGKWIIDSAAQEISAFLNKIFPTVASDEIKGMKYLKIFVNANNCIAAILGLSMQEAFSDLEVCRISIAIWKEGMDIAAKSGLQLVSLPDFPVERVSKLTALPTQEGAKIFSGIMNNLSKEPLYGSILQSIKRGRNSEIDYINGEFVNLAQANNLKAPLNEKLVSMVHEVEKSKKFFSKGELISAVKDLLNDK